MTNRRVQVKRYNAKGEIQQATYMQCPLELEERYVGLIRTIWVFEKYGDREYRRIASFDTPPTIWTTVIE